MQPSEVRAHVLRDHEALRGRLEGLEQLCSRVLDGRASSAAELRDAGLALLSALAKHMAWEDLYLAPALREADAWGQERAARLDADHREQREVLDLALDGLRDDSRPLRVQARRLRDLVALLRDDMVDEEQTLLDARVLRDDVVGIDVETG